ncbi:MAG: hypothetical protein KDC87_01790 [Planctomycetes bacterium]|nr:hypothetical protein [Planctomycetota bacterium]
MKHIAICVLSLLACSASLSAQNYFYSPPEYASSEGPYYAYYFLRYADGLQQQVDGEVRGKKMTISEVRFRADYRSHTTSTAPGKSWANVTVSCGKGDFDAFDSTFSSNRTSTLTMCFSGSVTWPTLSGNPLTNPDLWGGTTGAYRFPFSTNYAHDGTADLLMEYDFSGGTLANNLAWGSTTSRTYYLDSYGLATSTVSSTGAYIPATRLNNNSAGVTTRCNDGEHGTTTSGSYIYATATAYGGQYSVINYQNKVLFYHYSYYTGYENPIIHAIAFAKNDTGVNLNTGCNNLHLVGPMVTIPMVTFDKASNTSGYTGYYFQLIPWSSSMANLSFTMQGAWTETSSNRLALTQAYNVTLPAAGPPLKNAKRASCDYYNNTNATGTYSTSYIYNPVFCYTYN